MKFNELKLKGAYLITLDEMHDDRGFFARSFCKKEFEQNALHHDFVQCNISYNHKKGTLRGLHYQEDPYGEVKVVSCRRGKIFDVIVDIRQNSETFGKWIGIELSEINRNALYIPTGFAHGFQTLTDNAEVFYLMGNYFQPHAAKGICWDDQTLEISWPLQEKIISDQDKLFPGLAR